MLHGLLELVLLQYLLAVGSNLVVLLQISELEQAADELVALESRAELAEADAEAVRTLQPLQHHMSMSDS